MARFRIYRDNRLVPPVMVLVTMVLLWCLVDLRAPPPWPPRPDKDDDLHHNRHDQDRDHRIEQGGAPNTPKTAPPSEERPRPPLHRDEVLLILKTGATVLWRRLPIHLATTLAPDRIAPANVALYADVDAAIGNWSVVDILHDIAPDHHDTTTTTTTTTTGTTTNNIDDAWALYRSLRGDWADTNVYLEQTGLPGDDEGPPGGWRLDKYKFLPLVQHAGQHWPHVKWYLYTEDDTYLFLPNALHYLAAFDHREPHWLGGLGEKLGTTFAHGGSGFALSRAAWEQSFGQNSNKKGGGGGLPKKYQSFVDAACCGDYALGKVLNDHGVYFGEDHGATVQFWGWNGLPHWKIAFSPENWCVPVLTWHHAHNRDIARYHALEMSWDFSDKPLTYGDFYHRMIAPSLRPRRRWWDNLSSRYEVTSTSVGSAPRPPPGQTYDSEAWDRAWVSVDHCEAACKGWLSCVQWYYYGDDCKLDDRVFEGHGWPASTRYRHDKLESVSGWLTDRVAAWTCL